MGAPVREAAVRATGLSVARRRNPVLHELTFALAHGDLVGLLGPSGCGKTTLMRTLVGLQAHQRGTVTIDGLPAGDRALRARVGYSPQGSAVYSDLTVHENVSYFARCSRASEHEVVRVLERVSLTHFADRLAGSLSGGERSRVSLAMALLGSPVLLVLDEPTVGLDPVLREDLWGLFREVADAGAVVLVSSHVMSEAERCHRLLLVREGRLLADATPTELLARTGASSLDDAFLRLVRGEEGG